MSGYEIASLTGSSRCRPRALRWTPLRKHFGVTAFGINAYTATEAGQDVVQEHTEERLGHEELYVVLTGRATFVLDGEEPRRPAGSVVFLRDPTVKRYARAEEPGRRCSRGRQAGTARGLGLGVLLRRLRVADDGDYEGALAELDAGLARSAPTTRRCSTTARGILSRAGRLDEARAALDPRARARSGLHRWADEDDDLAALRVAGEPNPAARARSAGTGSASGRATTRTAP